MFPGECSFAGNLEKAFILPTHKLLMLLLVIYFFLDNAIVRIPGLL